MGKKRIEEFDIVKGLGIISVMIGHLIYRTEDSIFDCIVNASATGFVIAFFILSAYVYNPEKRSIKDEYINKIKGLFLPTILVAGGASIIGGIYCHFIHNYTFSQWVRNVSYTFLRFELSDRIYGGFDAVEDVLYLDLSPTWFIWTMLWTFVLFIPLAKLLHKKGAIATICNTAIFIIGTIIYVNVNQSPWNIAHVPLYLALMLFTQQAKEYNVANKILNMNVWASVITTIIAICSVGLIFYYIADSHMYEGQLGAFHVVKFDHWYSYHAIKNPLMPMKDIMIWTETIAYYLQGIFFLFIGLNISRLIKKIPLLSHSFIWIGKRSLDFLILHCLFALVFVDIMHTYNRPGANWYLPELTSTIVIKSIISFIGSLVCCTLYCIIKEKIKKSVKNA